VQIEQMEGMQKLFVQTKNSLYEITVIDRWSGEILVRGGQLFPGLTPARLSHPAYFRCLNSSSVGQPAESCEVPSRLVPLRGRSARKQFIRNVWFG
jgi:hypothetical protein